MHAARTVGGSENADLKSLFLRFSEGLADRVAGGAPRVHAARTTPVKDVGAQGPRTGRTPGLSLRRPGTSARALTIVDPPLRGLRGGV
jgi:hypothetical protein